MRTSLTILKHKVTGIIPEGEKGLWKVEQFEIDEMGAAFHNLREPLRPVSPGTFTRLMTFSSSYQSTVIMSDTDAEIRDHLEVIRQAHGDVLVNGLGLALVTMACARKSDVKSVTVIEKSKDVIDLVWPTVEKRFPQKVSVVHDDAFDFKPPRRKVWDVVWHDIWPDISLDNLEEMRRLRRKYQNKCYWQGCWCEKEMKIGRRLA